MKFENITCLYEFLTVHPTEQDCIDYLEKQRWPNGVVSPFDSTSKVYNYGNNKYRCKNTGKNFNVKTNTIFHNSAIPLSKWFFAIWQLCSCKKGITSTQLTRDLKVTQKTAWFMLQRIRRCYICENEGKLNNEVETDETFVGGKNKNRHKDKKVKNSQGRSFKDKTPVLGMIERGGKLICRVIKNTSKKEITPHILKHVNVKAILFTDEWVGYATVDKVYKHYIVDHGKGEYVNGDATTNSIEGFWSILKRGIIGIYNYISPKHLQIYVDEFVFRYNTRKVNDSERFNLFLCNTEHRITYKQLVK